MIKQKGMEPFRPIACRQCRRAADARAAEAVSLQDRARRRDQRAVLSAAAQPRADDPHPRDGRLPALQERAAAAAERVRDPDDRARVDAAVRMERALPDRGEGGREARRSPTRSPKGAGRRRCRKRKRSSTTSARSCIATRHVSDATYARALQGSASRRRRYRRHQRLLHAAGDGPEHRAHASWTVGRSPTLRPLPR